MDKHTKEAAQIFNVPETDVTVDQREFSKRLTFGQTYGSPMTDEAFIKRMTTIYDVKTYVREDGEFMCRKCGLIWHDDDECELGNDVCMECFNKRTVK